MEIYNLNKILETLENENDDNSIYNSSLDSDLKDYLEKLFNMSITEIPKLSSFLIKWIQIDLEKSNNLKLNVKTSFFQTVKDNIYNFSLAKTDNFLQGLKLIKKNVKDENQLNIFQKYANNIFKKQQKVENNQVAHMTDLVTNVSLSKNLLIFKTENDSKVRHTHKDLNNQVIEYSDYKYLNQVTKLMSEFNCRCNLVKAEADTRITKKKKVVYTEDSVTPSDIDFENGRAIIFTEELEVFKNVTPITRKLYKKNGF